MILFFAIAALVCFAWYNRFIWDDAFISFRYAYNLVHGHGLVWNVGEPIEGYTNFLWTLLMCIPFYFGYEPVTFSLVLGIIFFIFSLVSTYKTSLLLFHSRDIALLTIILLGTNYTFSSFATSGIETQLQACLFITVIYVLFGCLETNDWRPPRLLMLSLLLSTALLTRLDSLLLVVVIFPIALFYILKDTISLPQKTARMLALLVPFTVLIGIWFIWKLFYYGDIFPNTFYVKAINTSKRLGINYIYSFLISYLLVPFPLLFICAFKMFFKKTNQKMIALIAAILLWILYIIKIGGDYLDFRFMVPIMPLVFILFMWLIFVFLQNKVILTALITLLLLGSLHHKLTFQHQVIVGLDATVRIGENKLETWYFGQIGKALGTYFNYSPNVTIATYSAGGIPYYSRLKTIDESGLNDKWVARSGYVMKDDRPGHQRRAPLSYLLERNVNLLVNAWMLKRHNELLTIYSKDFLNDFFYANLWDIPTLPSTAKVLRIPIDPDKTLETIYLIKNSIIDDAIQKYKWEVYPIVPTK